MRIHFQKMNGAGNDFVMVDNREGVLTPTTHVIRALCDRRRGVGADGLILIERQPDADFRMHYYNSDGGEAAMCGNGARCAAVFAAGLGLGAREGDEVRLDFVAGAGRVGAKVRGERVEISMPDAVAFERSVVLAVDGGREVVHLVDTGVPHAVAVENDWTAMSDEQVVERGRRIRFHPRFSPAGVNVDFVSVTGEGTVRIRTYERGVETETLACGTGAVAAGVALAHVGRVASPVRLLTQGKETLRVSFAITPNGACDVLLEGPVAVNFEGFIEQPGKE
jgi:diaminopimelate epimerase